MNMGIFSSLPYVTASMSDSPTSWRGSSSDKTHRSPTEPFTTIPKKTHSHEDLAARRPDQLSPMSASFTPSNDRDFGLPDIGGLSFSLESESGEDKNEGTKFTSPDAKARNTREGQYAYSLPTTPGLSRSARAGAATAPTVGTFSPLTPFTPSSNQSLDVRVEGYSPASQHSSGRYKSPGSPTWSSPKEGNTGVLATSHSADNTGRYLWLCGIPDDVQLSEVQTLLNRLVEHKMVIYDDPVNRAAVIVVFYDSRQALKLFNYLQKNPVCFKDGAPLTQLHCMTIDRADVEQIAHRYGPNGPSASFWDDMEPSVEIQVVGKGVQLKDMKNSLSDLGDLHSLYQKDTEGKLFVATFYDTRVASSAVHVLNGMDLGIAHLKVRYSDSGSVQNWLSPQTPVTRRAQSGAEGFTLGSAAGAMGGFGAHRQLSPSRSNTSNQDVFGSADARKEQVYRPPALNVASAARYGSPLSPASPDFTWRKKAQMSPTSPVSIYTSSASPVSPVNSSWRRVPSFPLSGSTVVQTARGGGYNGDRKGVKPENRVHPDRIISGLDLRTTVMIKDVPNKLSRQELVDILNEVVPGGFDFVYLRFDFNNCCNVGYAFVNFTDVGELYKFYQAKVGRKWGLFSSEKVLQMSYADIQGKTALINKFRNSSVMNVIEQWRPQIFYTSGAKKGLEEPFPAPDNPDTLRASTEARFRTLSATLAASDSLKYTYRWDNDRFSGRNYI